MSKHEMDSVMELCGFEVTDQQEFERAVAEVRRTFHTAQTEAGGGGGGGGGGAGGGGRGAGGR